MAGSRLVAVRKAVIDGLGASGVSGVVDAVNALTTPASDVRFAFQWKEDPSVREWVYTGSSRFTHAPAAMRSGRNYRDETGRFSLVVLVAGVDMSQEEASTRCMAIATPCEEWIADRKNGEGLGVSGLLTLTVDGDGFLDEMYGDTGHLAIVDIPIKYTARLT